MKENFDRFKFFEIYKEKEMTDFRRWILALAVLALCVAGANAQVSGGTGGQNFQCTAANASVTPTVRAEGITELVGDIVLDCTGGTYVTPGAVIPQANITVFLNTQVTSRLLGIGGVTNASEAVLMIDEPNSGLQGYGPAQNFNYCLTPGSGCIEYASAVKADGTQVPYTTASGPTPGQNVFIGVVNPDGKSITFNGVPILPPVTSGATRVYRITNVRANASAIPAGANTPGNVQALISISGSSFVPLTNSQLVVGYVVAGLTASTQNFLDNGGLSGSGTSFNQCSSTGNSGNGAPTAILRYHSNFGTAFKTRVLASVSTNGQDGVHAIQNIPGSANNATSESGMIFNGLPLGNEGGAASTALAGSNGAVAGLADYGTRFQAVFNNIPAGVSIYVSTTNVTNITQNNGALVPAPGATNTTSSYAQLVVSSTASETVLNTAPVLSATGSNGNSTQHVDYVAFTPAAGTNTVTAVWEVINSNTSTNQNFDFGVYLAYSANVANNQPATGPITVNMSYSPIPPQSAANTGTVLASSSATIPRFIDLGTGDNKTIATINICQTNLLFPYITTITGFDTGIAISNTSMDPFGTGLQNGACTLNWYGNNNGGTTNTPIPSSTTATSGAPTILAGTTWVTDAAATGMAGQGFTGYMIAQCNFQYAHGYAAVTDIGSRGILTAYLALVMSGGRVGTAQEALVH